MKILFQGDSITDACRNYDDYHDLGRGYAKYAAEAIASRHPEEEFEFIDLGINGHQTIDLKNRWHRDCIDLQPDLVSILIGINDTWHRCGERNWLENEIFEANYRYILEETKNKTNAKIIMIEPFLANVPDKEYFREDLNFKIDVVRKLAKEYADEFIPLDGIFAEACIHADALAWTDEGIHPTANGARLIARHYADHFDVLYPLMRAEKK